MARIVFHGPNDSNECRKFVTKLAKQLGGKFSYNSFFDRRRMEYNNGWFSQNTVGKAAYCIMLPHSTCTEKGSESRKIVAQIVRDIRKINNHGLKLRTFY